jgi:hypothetical protein
MYGLPQVLSFFSVGCHSSIHTLCTHFFVRPFAPFSSYSTGLFAHPFFFYLHLPVSANAVPICVRPVRHFICIPFLNESFAHAVTKG